MRGTVDAAIQMPREFLDRSGRKHVAVDDVGTEIGDEPHILTEKFNVPAKVVSIEYDPNRSARIALLHYADGEKRYILAPKALTVGQVL